MKNCIAKFQFLVCGLFPFFALAQADIPVNFSKRGFVQNIDYEQKLILVNFVPDEEGKKKDKKKEIVYEINSETLELKDPQVTNENKDKLTINDLKSSDEILVEGEYFREAKYKQINKITIISIKVKPIEGRIDLIKGEFAYVNGNKVKLKEGKTITGKGGFEGHSYEGFTKIAEGDFADVGGKYNPDGYFLADRFTITPEEETSYDKTALEVEKDNYDKLYPLWIDKNKRKTLFGSAVPGLGKITADAALQDYVSGVGLKLVPAHIKKKINFIFIVVDNPDLLAYVRANGLAYICTGLLKNLENEAQLATVLGHEIAHAIYEHQAEDAAKTDKKEKNKLTLGNIGKGVVNAISIRRNGENLKSGRGHVSEEQQERTEAKNESNAVAKDNLLDLSSSYADKRSSDFSVDQEFLADRVGLCLMVQAGYDPREAPIVWKNIFDRYGVKTKVEEGVQLADTWAEEMSNPDNDANAKKPSSIFVKWKTDDYKAKSTKTHPDEIKRFEELNRLIALYWNNAELIASTVNGEDKYLEMKRRIKVKK
ncbi:M48 family metalloprotease [Flavobacterium sp.]|uniref:M48 family metalloprotease n=1 Tax=Flavobacterium sp. TaxID=239 RepID=UPI0039E26CCE